MKLSIISGSHRSNSYSVNAAKYLQRLALSSTFTESEIFDLGEINLPMWDESLYEDSKTWAPWKQIANQLRSADAVIIISPEWHGMATPAIKNFLLLCTQQELGHKPMLLASVSTSINGVYPISELRMTATKNNHACILPDHLIFRNCESLLDSDSRISDEEFNGRAEHTINMLAAYTDGLVNVRQKLRSSDTRYQYGM